MNRKNLKNRFKTPGILFAFITLGLLVGARLLSAVGLSLSPCPFFSLTGYPCPTCYGVRSLTALGGGDVAGAFSMQPLITAAALLLLAWGVLSLFVPARLELVGSKFLSAARAGKLGWALPFLVLSNWAFLILKT